MENQKDIQQTKMEWCRINEDGEIEFNSEEVKLVPEVKAILAVNYNKGMKGDSSGREKLRAKTEVKYLYLRYSNKSPYRDYDEKEQIEEAKKDCGFSEHWVESPELQALIPKFIKGNTSIEERALNTAKKFLQKFENHLNDITLDERNASGGLVHDPGKIMKTLEQLPSFLLKIGEFQRQISQGTVANPTSKGDHEIGWMAMGDHNDGQRKGTNRETSEGDESED